MTVIHSERKHSKFSASGFERIAECPGSVELSEGIPDKPNVWSIEGTEAHEVLETLLRYRPKASGVVAKTARKGMLPDVMTAAEFILGKRAELPHAEFLIETRVYLDFIHPEAFGTFDSAVVEHFGTLHVFDFKYGKHLVTPVKNYQMIYYAMALAHRYQWNFQKVCMWIVQPRVTGYDGPTFWEITIEELRAYVPVFRRVIERAEKFPNLYVEGSWCYFCKAKGKCPLKQEAKSEKAIKIFSVKPKKGEDNLKSEAEWRKQSRREKIEKQKEKRRKKEADFY